MAYRTCCYRFLSFFLSFFIKYSPLSSSSDWDNIVPDSSRFPVRLSAPPFSFTLSYLLNGVANQMKGTQRRWTGDCAVVSQSRNPVTVHWPRRFRKQIQGQTMCSPCVTPMWLLNRNIIKQNKTHKKTENCGHKLAHDCHSENRELESRQEVHHCIIIPSWLFWKAEHSILLKFCEASRMSLSLYIRWVALSFPLSPILHSFVSRCTMQFKCSARCFVLFTFTF